LDYITLHTFALPFGLFSQPDLMLVRDDAVMAAAFDHVTACGLNYRLGAKKLAEGQWWKVGVAAIEKNRRIAIDEELLITGVSVSEENQRVLNGGVSAS
jgi:hypothetical protein